MKKILIIFSIIILIPLLTFSRSIDEIKKSGVIYVAFTEGAYNSINRDIAEEFALFLNVKLEPVFVSWDDNFAQNGVIPADITTNPDYDYTPDALKKADFICGTIYIVPWRKNILDFAGTMQVSDLLVVKKTSKEWSSLIHLVIPYEYLSLIKRFEIKTYDNLENLKIAVLGNSIYQTNLEAIEQKINKDINIIATKNEAESQEMLQSERADGFVATSYLALKYLKDHENSRLAFPTSKAVDVGWAVENGNNGLKKEINNFYETIKGNGKLDQLFQNQYSIDYKTYLEIINSYSDSQNTSTRDLDEILESGIINISLRNREMIYQRSGKKQFTHYLAESFAAFLGVELQLTIVETLSEYFKTSEGIIKKDSAYIPAFFNDVDVACDLLAPVPWRLNKIDVIGYAPNAKVVVARKNIEINTIADLSKYKGVTAPNSSYEQELKDNGIENYITVPTPELLNTVADGKADYTIVSFSIHSLPEYPNLEAKFILGELQETGWAIKKNQPKLRQKILEFFEYAENYDIFDTHFKNQTGMPFKAAENYLTALHQTYNIGVFPFVFYGSEEGLPQEDVLSVYQDNEGYIWFGTYAGAVKFNGRDMQNYNMESGMVSNEVFDIKQDTLNNFYFATLSGISILKDNKFTTIFENMAFKHIFIDAQNNKWFYGNNGIWILTAEGEKKQLSNKIKALPLNINSIMQDKKQEYTFIAASEGLYILNQDNSLQKISNEDCYYVFLDEDEKLWISSKSGLYYGNIDDFTVQKFGERINKQINIGDDVINNVYQTEDGAIWLISNFKAYQLFTLKQKPIIFDKKIGLSGERILSFFVDNEDNYWFGFSGGVQKLTNKSLRIIHPKIFNNKVNSIIHDNNNNMWFAFSNNIFTLQDTVKNISNLFNKENRPYSLAKNKKDEIVVATTTGLFIINERLKILKENYFEKEIPHIENVFVASDGKIFILTGSAGMVYYFENFDAEPKIIKNTLTALIYQLTEFDGMIVGGNSTGIVFFDGEKFKILQNLENTVWSLSEIDDQLYVGTENGLGIYDQGEFEMIEIEDMPNSNINAIRQAVNKDYIWLGTNKGLCYLEKKENKIEFFIDSKDGLPSNEIAINGVHLDGKGLLWIGTLHGIATFDIKKNKIMKYAPDCSVEFITLNGEKVETLGKKLRYFENNIVFELTGLSFINEKSIEYDYLLRGLSESYGEYEGNSYKAIFQNLPAEKYEFIYRTKGKDGIWSYYKSLKFEITKPFWARLWFIILIIILVGGSFFGIFKWRERLLKKRNEQLEETILERTSEIRQQKANIEEKNAELEQQQEEIISQKDELLMQKNVAEKQRDEISEQQEDILDSIYYAKRIQTALLPPDEHLDKILPEYFILYKPRDIVSGDFYWFRQFGESVVIVAADCTGHGVPGAFMSMLGSALLSEITLKHEHDLDSGIILNDLRDMIIKSLHQTGKVEEAKDGMDLAITILNHKEMTLQFSGAFNPLYLIREGSDEITEYRADRMPIGIFDIVNKNFTRHDVEIIKGDSLYTFSDGYSSQFGGKKGKKFKSSRLKKLILSVQEKSMKEQHEMFDTTIENWMGVKYDQIDDVLLIGMKV